MEVQNFDTSACARLRAWVSEKCKIAEGNPKCTSWFAYLSKIETAGIDISVFHAMHQSTSISIEFTESFVAMYRRSLIDIGDEFTRESDKMRVLIPWRYRNDFMKKVPGVVSVTYSLMDKASEEYLTPLCEDVREKFSKQLTWSRRLSRIATVAEADIAILLTLHKNTEISNRFSAILLNIFCQCVKKIHDEIEHESWESLMITPAILEEQLDFSNKVSEVVAILNSTIQIAEKEVLKLSQL